MFVNDPSFLRKVQSGYLRGKIRSSRVREKFLRMYYGSAICDCGVVGKNEGCPDEWMTSKKNDSRAF